LSVLAIDTSHAEGAVSLHADGKTETIRFGGAQGSHLVDAAGAVDHLLHERGLAARELERLALVIGPGSFTGLRVGLAYAKGLHAALDVPLVTMGTLGLLAAPQLVSAQAVGAMIDARKNEVYGAVYRASDDGIREIVPPQAMAPDAFAALAHGTAEVLVGSGVIRYRETIGAVCTDAIVPEDGAAHLPSTEWLAEYATQLSPLSSVEIRLLEPFYLRSSGARLGKLRPIGDT